MIVTQHLPKMLLRNLVSVFLCIYLRTVNISCEDGSSLAFAIDDTLSMDDDISHVKREAAKIMKLVLSKKSNINNLVLVTFNDPDVHVHTTPSSKNTSFLRDLNAISTHGGGDCPEKALTGIEEALKASGPESNVYVFTDANAKDYDKLNKIKSLCQKKQSQVVIVYSRDYYCYQPYGEKFTVYYDIANACSGQVFIVKKDEVHSVLKTIEILLQGKQSIFKWILVPRTNYYYPVEFKLDEKAEYAIVSTSGQKVYLKVTRERNQYSPEVYLERTMWNENGKVVKLINPQPGTYYAWVKGESTISVVVYGRTDFTFEHGFSVLQPKLLSDASKQPIAGLKQIVSINVTDPDNAVEIKKLQILDVKNGDSVYTEKLLTKIGENFYITEGFVSPDYTFRIAVIGEIKMTRETITRYSKNIDPQFVDLIPESVPSITIKEGTKLEVNYGSDVSLTCKVTAHPAPKIEWYTFTGRPLPSKSSVVDDPEFVSYVNLKDIKQNEVYTCGASNKKGQGSGKIEVTVRPIFTNVGEAIHNAKYGEDARIPCNIKSYLPFKIKWFRNGSQLSAASNEYSISPDGSELTVISMNLEKQGKYTCEAILSSDPTIKKIHDRDVKITGLAYPTITFAKADVYKQTYTAICRINGVPTPIINWYFKPEGSNKFSTISTPGEVFKIPEVKLKDTGIYKCVGTNILDETEHEFNFVAEERPIIHNKEDEFYAVEGDAVVKIPCNVTGFPVPTIVWMNNDNVLELGSKFTKQGTNLIIHNPLVSDSSAEYICEASNKLGNNSKTFKLEVVENIVDDKLNGDTHEIFVEQDKPKIIKCNLKNVGENSVRWYLNGMLTKQTGTTYTIEHPSMSDEGNYTCRVNTDEGSTSETYSVYVGYLPVFLDSRPSPVLLDWQDVDQLLDCAAESQPPAKYVWSHNNVPMSSGNNLPELPVSGWGEYTCRVSNELGKISRSFKVTTSGCYITSNAITQNQPLLSDIATPAWSSFTGKNDVLITANNKIKLSCPSNKYINNIFKLFPNKKEIIAKCISQDKFTVTGKTYKYSDLQCNAKVEPSIKHTGKQCSGSNSEALRVGFEVNDFLEAYTVCYDNRLNVPLFASAAEIKMRIGQNGVNTNKFEWSVAPELGSFKTGNWKPEGSCECCYTKGQLVNANELPFGPAKDASFKENLNSVPIWNPTCGDNNRISWHTFDNVIREISSEQEKWLTWTGASEYILKDGGMVPRFLWKVILHDDGVSVMVYVNDASPVEGGKRCSAACEPIIDADDFLYCCTLDDFTKNFGVPRNTFHA